MQRLAPEPVLTLRGVKAKHHHWRL